MISTTLLMAVLGPALESSSGGCRTIRALRRWSKMPSEGANRRRRADAAHARFCGVRQEA